MRMGLVSFAALVLLAPAKGWAQALQSFQDLALRVNLDDQLQVEDQLGDKATGRLTRLTRDEIAIQTDAGEKRFTTATVREVAVRGHSLGKGALIGAEVVAVLGAVELGAGVGGADAEHRGDLGVVEAGVELERDDLAVARG